MEQGKHISIQRMARLEMERSDRPDPSLEALTRHMAECDACCAVYEEVKRTIRRSPGPAYPPAFYQALDSEPCPRMESVENYQRLPLAERLSVWAHVVFGHCDDCAAMARACGLVLDVHKDPVTQSLAERLGARAPRIETPVFLHAMAGAASEDAGLTETMNATVLMTVRPRKRSYRLTVYRKRPAEPGGFWRVRVQFEEGDRLPRGFSMFIYQDGSPISLSAPATLASLNWNCLRGFTI